MLQSNSWVRFPLVPGNARRADFASYQAMFARCDEYVEDIKNVDWDKDGEEERGTLIRAVAGL